MCKEIREIQHDLDYGKFQYQSLIALFGYGDKAMIVHNKIRAMAAIECLEEILNDTKKYIEKLD